MSTWILCANLRGARLFRVDDQGALSFMREFDRPRVFTRDADFPDDSDMVEVLSDPVLEQEEKVAARYAKHLGHRISLDLARHRFGSLVVCAEPRLLGILVSSFPDALRQAISGIVEQDLYEVNESDLLRYVSDLKREPHQRKVS